MHPHKHGRSITSQLLGLAIAPTLIMCLVLCAWLYGSRMREIDRDLDERGKLLAEALAETSRYGVMAGNLPSLQVTLEGLIASEGQITALEVLDEHWRPLAQAQTPSPGTGAVARFERPIRTLPLAVDLSEGLGMLGAGDGTKPARQATVGYVRVTLTKEPLLQAKRRDLLYATLFTAAAAGICGLIGLLIASRLRHPLKRVMGALREIRMGQYAVDLPADEPGELGELQHTIVDMAAALSTARHNLEAKVAARTVELQAAVDVARVANEERSQLIARSHAQIEEERERIARELHDELGSMLVALRLKTQHIAHLSQAGAPEVLADITRLAQELHESLTVLYSNARGLIEQLRPEMLDALGLREALSDMVRTYDTLHSDCHFSLAAETDFPELRGPEAIIAYRLVQEALTNVVKHSGATRAKVKLGIDRDSVLQIVVMDNGRGFDPESAGKGRLGLLGMRERLAVVGGAMTIKSGPEGSTFTFKIPLAIDI